MKEEKLNWSKDKTVRILNALVEIKNRNLWRKNIVEHRGTKGIETERIILRKFTKEDAEVMFKNWQSDSKVTEFLRWPTAINVSEAEQVIDEWIKGYETPDFYQWAIVLKEVGEPIGTISVVDKNEKLDIVHIGYCIGSKWWHQGITTEAFKAIIPFFFEEVGVNRIESQHDPNNPNSGKVMQKCGLRYEGTLRQADWSNKGVVDACMYSLLKSEWAGMS
jgi:ribosomal-protein-alanine N-acetyltransferase